MGIFYFKLGFKLKCLEHFIMLLYFFQISLTLPIIICSFLFALEDQSQASQFYPTYLILNFQDQYHSVSGYQSIVSFSFYTSVRFFYFVIFFLGLLIFLCFLVISCLEVRLFSLFYHLLEVQLAATFLVSHHPQFHWAIKSFHHQTSLNRFHLFLFFWNRGIKVVILFW